MAYFQGEKGHLILRHPHVCSLLKMEYDHRSVILPSDSSTFKDLQDDKAGYGPGPEGVWGVNMGEISTYVL